MKHIIYIAIFFLSALSFAQEAGSISGKILDFESNSEPLIFAKVSIKETGTEVLSDEKGFFKFENLKTGEYTLVSTFTGYETKETKITVAANNTNIKLVLEPSSLSLEDLVATMASVENSASTTSN
ncbi:carboxypeptidase-like regulatory domain-containing protein [Algibacter sp. R77976]|uniref:carboxypeptidase-like regulatory domain-containing protein n=1 Tax=Algibacter sp. R77976 TaxID=3093873 RepID=UPI0037C91522